MKYLSLIMVIINIIVIYKTNKKRSKAETLQETKIILKEIMPLWKNLANFILFGLTIFLLSFTIRGSKSLYVNEVYNIIAIIYVVLNLFSLISFYRRFNKFI